MAQQEPSNIAQRDLIEASNTAGFFQLLDAHIEEADRGKIHLGFDFSELNTSLI